MKKITSKQIAFENYERDKKSLAKSSERAFGLVFAFVFLLIGFLKYKHDILSWNNWYNLACCMLAVALLYPKILHPFNKAWMQLGVLLHRITNPIMMGILFFGMFSPIGIITRIAGRDPMRIKQDPSLNSYWIIRNPSQTTDLKNQF